MGSGTAKGIGIAIIVVGVICGIIGFAVHFGAAFVIGSIISFTILGLIFIMGGSILSWGEAAYYQNQELLKIARENSQPHASQTESGSNSKLNLSRVAGLKDRPEGWICSTCGYKNRSGVRQCASCGKE